MVAASLILFVSFLCGRVAVLEQPSDSCMPASLPMATVLRFIGAQKWTTWHSAFGAPSAKPFQIWSTSDIVAELRRPKTVGPSHARLTTVRIAEGGRRRVSGTAAMRGSEAYTPAFGRAVAEMLAKHLCV
jgi:hypothetical protein